MWAMHQYTSRHVVYSSAIISEGTRQGEHEIGEPLWDLSESDMESIVAKLVRRLEERGSELAVVQLDGQGMEPPLRESGTH